MHLAALLYQFSRVVKLQNIIQHKMFFIQNEIISASASVEHFPERLDGHHLDDYWFGWFCGHLEMNEVLTKNMLLFILLSTTDGDGYEEMMKSEWNQS